MKYIVYFCSDENKVTMANAGGIELIVSAMKEHKSSAGVQEKGCGALRNLASNGRKRERRL